MEEDLSLIALVGDVFFSVRKSTRIFGAGTEEKQRSMSAQFHGRKYMGVWSLESEVTVNMMRRFPMRVVVQTNRNTRNKASWSS